MATHQHQPGKLIYLMTTLLLSAQAQAISVTANIEFYSDTDNHLGFGNSIAIGDSANASFEISGLPVSNLGTGIPGYEEYFFQTTDVDFSIDIGGQEFVTPTFAATALPVPALAIADSIDLSIVLPTPSPFGLFGFGDIVAFNLFGDSPSVEYPRLIWSISLFDPDGSAFSGTDYFNPSSSNDFTHVAISAFLWDPVSRTGESLLLATGTTDSTAVPLPATG